MPAKMERAPPAIAGNGPRIALLAVEHSDNSVKVGDVQGDVRNVRRSAR